MSTSKMFHQLAASAMALAIVGISATASAQQAVVVNDDDDGSRGPNAFLFHSGLITTGLSYTPALVVAVNSDRSEDKYLYAPFVGPWLDLANRDDDNKVARTLLVVDGVFQTIGAIQLIASFIFIDSGSRDVASSEDDSLVSQTVVAPARLASDGYGLVAVGRF